MNVFMNMLATLLKLLSTYASSRENEQRKWSICFQHKEYFKACYVKVKQR